MSAPANAPALSLDRFLPYRLSVLANTVSAALAGAYASRFGLTIPQWRVIAVLARSPGLYGPVHRHPSTVVALRELYRELRVAGPTALTALARTGRGNEPARVAAEVARLLAPSWYDEGDLLAAAASVTRSTSAT